MTQPTPGSGGEVLKLGPPATGTVIVSVDARRAPSPFTAAVQTLLPGGELPVHRSRDWDAVWVVLKGQGRVTLGDRVSTVVHGAVLSVPRQVWFGLRNTGNGPLQAVVVSAPAGVDGLFREFAQLGHSPDPADVQQAAQRYGVELRSAGGAEPAQPAGRERHRHRRGGRRRGQPRAIQVHPAAAPPATSSAPAAVQPPGAGAASQQPAGLGGGRRRRRRGGRGRGAGQKPAAASTPAPPQAQKPQPPRPQPSSQGRSKKRDGRGRSRHVKEVYMGGKWVQVSGEGPVIASGESGSERHHQVDEGGPGGPLSVSL